MSTFYTTDDLIMRRVNTARWICDQVKKIEAAYKYGELLSNEYLNQFEYVVAALEAMECYTPITDESEDGEVNCLTEAQLTSIVNNIEEITCLSFHCAGTTYNPNNYEGVTTDYVPTPTDNSGDTPESNGDDDDDPDPNPVEPDAPYNGAVNISIITSESIGEPNGPSDGLWYNPLGTRIAFGATALYDGTRVPALQYWPYSSGLGDFRKKIALDAFWKINRIEKDGVFTDRDLLNPFVDYNWVSNSIVGNPNNLTVYEEKVHPAYSPGIASNVPKTSIDLGPWYIRPTRGKESNWKKTQFWNDYNRYLAFKVDDADDRDRPSYLYYEYELAIPYIGYYGRGYSAYGNLPQDILDLTIYDVADASAFTFPIPLSSTNTKTIGDKHQNIPDGSKITSPPFTDGYLEIKQLSASLTAELEQIQKDLGIFDTIRTL